MDNLFESSTDDNQEKLDPNKNYLEELVGEGKKFQSPEELAKGKYLADIHIQNLEQRMDELREEFNKVSVESKAGQRLQDLLDQLEAQKANLNRDDTHNSNEDNKPVYDPKEIESLVSNKLQQFEQTRKQQENFNLVRSKLEEHFGRNYKDAIKDQSEALGLSDDDVNQMARTNPNLFFKTFDLTSRSGEQFQAPPQSSVRGGVYNPPKKRTMSHYRELRKKDPGLYFSKEIAVQMDKDAQELGAAFFD